MRRLRPGHPSEVSEQARLPDVRSGLEVIRKVNALLDEGQVRPAR